MENKEDKTQTDLDWDQRTLCSDESCIGVIGPDGRCNECGRPYAGIFDAPPETSATPDSEAMLDTDAPDEQMEDGEDYDTEESRPDSDWDRRTLCSDESCIGVIGPDGRCNECGKPYDSEQ